MNQLPALFTNKSKRFNFEFILLENSLTESKSAKSKCSTSILLLFVCSIILSAAFCALFKSRQANITVAPRLAKSNAVS